MGFIVPDHKAGYFLGGTWLWGCTLDSHDINFQRNEKTVRFRKLKKKKAWNLLANHLLKWLAINWMIFTQSLHGKLLFNQTSTPPKTNMEPENGPLEKEIPIGNHHFQVPC